MRLAIEAAGAPAHLARPRILVPEMKSNSSFLLGSKKAMHLQGEVVRVCQEGVRRTRRDKQGSGGDQQG